jgi:hypothetical protein
MRLFSGLHWHASVSVAVFSVFVRLQMVALSVFAFDIPYLDAENRTFNLLELAPKKISATVF